MQSVAGSARVTVAPVVAQTPSTDRFVQQVRACLEHKVAGQSKDYATLVQQVRRCSDIAILARFIDALTHCIGVLSRHPRDFPELLSFVFSFEWSAPDDFAARFMSLVTNLVSSNSYYAVMSFEMLVKAFKKDLKAGSEAAAGTSASAAPAVPAPSPVNITYVHNTVKAILYLAPSASPVLLRVLEEQFPHKRLSAAVHEAYLRNLLCVLNYVPALRLKLIPFVVTKLIDIDVRGGQNGVGEERRGEAGATEIQPLAHAVHTGRRLRSASRRRKTRRMRMARSRRRRRLARMMR